MDQEAYDLGEKRESVSTATKEIENKKWQRVSDP
jgi:hypothetical protein